MLKKKIHPATYISLMTIAFGITQSAVHEVEFKLLGFIAAVLSTFTGVLHNALMKKTIDSHFEDDVFQVHYHTTITATLIMLPLSLMTDLWSFALSVSNSEDRVYENMASFFSGFPFFELCLSIFTQYIQTIMSTLVLSQVSVVSHQVSNTLKRLIVIVSSILFFKNSVNISNAIGICLALIGFLMYGLTVLVIEKYENTAKGNLNRLGPFQIIKYFFGSNDICELNVVAFDPISKKELDLEHWTSKETHA
jgi:solute carrier family 35, member E1